MESNKIIKYSVVFVIIVLGVVFILAQNPAIKSLMTGDIIKDNTLEVKKDTNQIKQIFVSIKDYNYYPNVIKLKKGIPISMVFDMKTISGCYKSINIYELGIANRIVKQGDNIITFTPEKIGTFTMQCSMGMGKATIVVEE